MPDNPYADLIPGGVAVEDQDPSDLQGREREGGQITPEEMDFLWQARQRSNEQARASAMNEGVDPSGRQYIDQPDAGIQTEPENPYADLIPKGDATDTQVSSDNPYADLIPQGDKDIPETDSALRKAGREIASQGLTPQEEAGAMQEFEKAHPYVSGAIKALVPTSVDQLTQMTKPPMETNVEEQQKESEIWGKAVRGELGPEAQSSAITGTVAALLPLAHMGFGVLKQATSETARIGGETDASKVTSTESVPERPVRARVGEEAPLRQPGETPGAQEPVSAGESVAPPVQAKPDAPGQVGISRARTEAELGEGSVVPGSGAVLGEGLEKGRNYIRKGGDPELPIRRAKASGVVSQDDVGIVHAELERLRGERIAASKAFEANPDDPIIQKQLAKADDAQRAWRKKLQPVLTAASNALKEAYATSLPEGDPGTLEGLTNLMDEHFKGEREVTPEMRTAMAKAVKGVKEMREGANGKMRNIEETLTKQMKGKKVMSPRELDADLRSELETQFKDCVVGG